MQYSPLFVYDNIDGMFLEGMKRGVSLHDIRIATGLSSSTIPAYERIRINMNKYTRGKWRVLLNCEGSYSIFTERGRNRRRIHAECFTGDYGIAPHEAKANAVLVAHAPEMYDMLLECAEFLECYSITQDEDNTEYAEEIGRRIETLLSSIAGMETDDD